MQELVDLPFREVTRKRFDFPIANVLAPERLESLHDSAGALRAVKQVAVGTVLKLDLVETVLVSLIGTAANVNEFCRYLSIEAQRIESGIAGRGDDPLASASDSANDLVGAYRHFTAHEHASLGHVVNATDSARKHAFSIHAPKRVGGIAPTSNIGEVSGREGPAGSKTLYSPGDCLCPTHNDSLSLMNKVYAFFIKQCREI